MRKVDFLFAILFLQTRPVATSEGETLKSEFPRKMRMISKKIIRGIFHSCIAKGLRPALLSDVLRITRHFIVTD